MSAQLYLVWGIVLKYYTIQSIIARQWSHLVWLSHQLNCASMLEVYLLALECSISMLMKYTEINLCHEYQSAIVPTCNFTHQHWKAEAFSHNEQLQFSVNEIHRNATAHLFWYCVSRKLENIHNIELILISILIYAWCPIYASWKKLSFPWRPICT